jgi:hypothetical protein
VRDVLELDGSARYLCRSCFAYLRNVEWRAVVRRQVAALFGKLLPRIFRSGALEVAI